MPFSVAVSFTGILLALLLHDLTGAVILGGSLALVVFYVLAKLRNEDFIRTAIRDESDSRRRDALQRRTFQIESLDAESRLKMKAIVKLHNEIAGDIENLPASVLSAGLADTIDLTQHVVDRALEMAQKKRDLQRYLSKTDEHDIQARIQTLQEKLRNEPDSTAKLENENSLASKQRELADYAAIKQSASLIIDQLDTIESSFASLRAKLVRIQSTDIAEWTSANDQVKTELSTLNTSVDVLEQSVNEALSTQLPE